MEVLAVTALGRIPENSRVTKACYEWNREGEKNARGEENIRRRRTRVSGPDARVPLVTSFPRFEGRRVAMRKKGSGQKHARGNLSSLTRIAEAFVTFVTAREKGARGGDTHYVSPS